MAITEMNTTISNFRKEIKTKIVELFKKYHITELDCTDACDCPIVLPASNGEGCDTYTLDKVCVDSKGNVTFDCSSAYNNDFVLLSSVPIEELIDLYEWLEDNIMDLLIE